MKANPKWIIDEYMIKDEDNIDLLPSLDKLDIEYSIVPNDFKQIMIKPSVLYPYTTDECVIPYTSIEVGKRLKGYFGSYLNDGLLQYSTYYSYFDVPTDYYLNNDFIMTTWFDLTHDPDKFISLFKTGKLFIRPNSGYKIFTGFSVDSKNELLEEMNALNQTSSVSNDTLICVSKKKNIRNEWRFLICNNEVIGGSSYILDNEIKAEPVYGGTAWMLAELVAEKDDELDVFTVDVCQLENDEFKIVELNSFNCAGLYAIPRLAAVKSITQFVEKSYNDLYEFD